MHVLIFSLDPSLLQPEKQVFGETLRRQIEVADLLDGLHIVVRSYRGKKSTPKRFGRNLWIYPTISRNRLTYLKDAYLKGLEVCQRWPIAMVASQDPFYSALPVYALHKRLGIPFNVMIPGEVLDNPFWLREHHLNRVLNFVGKWMLRRASTVRVSTGTEREQIISMGIPSERVWNVPFRVSFKRLTNPNGDPLRDMYLGDRSDRMVLSVGRLAKEKDFLTGLLAMRQVVHERPSTIWVIVGSGPEEHVLKKQAQALGLAEHVFFTGPQPYEMVPNYYGAADCFLLCSTREGTSMVLLEAAYFGLPIVSTDTTGARDAVRDGETGYLAPRGDSKALAERLLGILDNPSLARSMGEQGRVFVQEAFDPELLLRRYLDLWYATAGTGPPTVQKAGST